ncbi:hypothetical protein [Comamonas terrae]|uniref:Lipoprotein n=1 Tax=Comamonas terrae TaxID=673548 RepID=A0ABW5UGT5_9BURK|nr:hypothetical protein [Comamonas terrae]
MTTRIPLLALVGSAACSVLLAGCGSTTPNYDTHFGEAVRTARLQMTINPDAGKAVGKGVDAPTGMDGRATEASMERYERSFKTPPPAVNVINIGGSLSSNSSGGGGGGSSY